MRALPVGSARARFRAIWMIAACAAALGSSAGFAADSEADARARAILETLVGEWTFTLGETTSGKRTVEFEYPGQVLRWRESFDQNDVRGSGFTGWDSSRQEFFSMAVHNVDGEHGHMRGKLEAGEPVIVWQPVVAKGEPFRSEFRLLSPDRFQFTALRLDDEGEWAEVWVARFDRSQDADPSP